VCPAAQVFFAIPGNPLPFRDPARCLDPETAGAAGNFKRIGWICMRYQWLRSSLMALSPFLVAVSAFAQTGSLAVTPTGGPTQAPGAFQGSVPSGPPSSGPLSLSLDEAVKRGLRYNLGAINSQQSLRQAQGESIVALSPLLPNLSSSLREIDQQIDLAAFGFKFKTPPGSGFSIPTIVGPFNYFDLRGNLTQKLADVQALRTYQSSREARRAADFSVQDSREFVVYIVTAGYLQVIAESARVDSAKVQVESAQAIYQQALDRFTSGLSARIDMTRSQVELHTQQQLLTSSWWAFCIFTIRRFDTRSKTGVLIRARDKLILTSTLPYIDPSPPANTSLPSAENLPANDKLAGES